MRVSKGLDIFISLESVWAGDENSNSNPYPHFLPETLAGFKPPGFPAGLPVPRVILHCEFAQSSCLFLLIDINDLPFAVAHRRHALPY